MTDNVKTDAQIIAELRAEIVRLSDLANNALAKAERWKTRTNRLLSHCQRYRSDVRSDIHYIAAEKRPDKQLLAQARQRLSEFYKELDAIVKDITGT